MKCGGEDDIEERGRGGDQEEERGEGDEERKRG